jgi:ABC-2 type transport system permease protein
VPVHDQGYRRYAGWRGSGGAWRVIAATAVAAELRRRRVVALLLVAWLPFLVFAVRLYVGANFTQAAFLAATPATFRDFLGWQSIFVFFVTILVGAGLIADDRRANALQIYLSKPLTRLEYVVGKLLALAAFLAFVTVLPGLLLLFLQMMFAGSTQFVREHLFLVPAILVSGVAQVLVASIVVLALSALSTSRRFVAVLYAGLIFFSQGLQRALVESTGSPLWALLSPSDTLEVVADAAFRIPAVAPVPVAAALAVLGGLVGASILVLERRIRGVEVVA